MSKSLFPYYDWKFFDRRGLLHSDLAPLRSARGTSLPQKIKSRNCLRPPDRATHLKSVSLCENHIDQSDCQLRGGLESSNDVAADPKNRGFCRAQKNKLAQLTSQKGFFTVIGALLIVVLLILSAALLSLAHLTRKKMALSSHCVHSVLKLQHQLKKPLSQLLRMNPQATRLRAQKLAAEVRMSSALLTGVAPVIAAAKAHLIFVTQKQIAFKARQQLILLEARTRREQFKILNLRKNIFRRTRHLGESNDLAVTPSPLGSLSPNYEVSPNFRENQGQTYELRNKIYLPLMGFMRLLTDRHEIEIHTLCSASLKQKGNLTWTPILKEAKASWRSSYGSF